MFVVRSPLSFQESLQPAPYLAYRKHVSFINYWLKGSPFSLCLPKILPDFCSGLFLDWSQAPHSKRNMTNSLSGSSKVHFTRFEMNGKDAFPLPHGRNNTFTTCFKVINHCLLHSRIFSMYLVIDCQLCNLVCAVMPLNLRSRVSWHLMTFRYLC